MKLTAGNVHGLFVECLYTDEEAAEFNGQMPPPSRLGEGIVVKAGFHPGRLDKAKPVIKEMLSQLPEQFHKKTGGGWSFLNMCQTKDGNQWGQHRDMDELLCLAKAAGYASYPMPENMWNMLPGGMPYVVFDVEAP